MTSERNNYVILLMHTLAIETQQKATDQGFVVAPFSDVPND